MGALAELRPEQYGLLRGPLNGMFGEHGDLRVKNKQCHSANFEGLEPGACNGMLHVSARVARIFRVFWVGFLGTPYWVWIRIFFGSSVSSRHDVYAAMYGARWQIVVHEPAR